mgnify:FL=1
MERWLAYFANRLTSEEKEELAMSEPAIRDAMEAEKIFMSNPDDYLRYVNRQMALMAEYQKLIAQRNKLAKELGSNIIV